MTEAWSMRRLLNTTFQTVYRFREEVSMTTRAHNTSRNLTAAPVRPQSRAQQASISHPHTRPTTAATSLATSEAPQNQAPSSQTDTMNPPPAPSRHLPRNLAAPQLARRPPTYSTAHPTTVEPSVRREVRRVNGHAAAAPIYDGSTALSVPQPSLNARSRSRSKGRDWPAVPHVREEPEERPISRSSDDSILDHDDTNMNIAGLLNGWSGQNELLGLEDEEMGMQGEWDDDLDSEERMKIDTRIIGLWREKKQFVDPSDLKVALEESMRENVASLSKDAWIWEPEEDADAG